MFTRFLSGRETCFDAVCRSGETAACWQVKISERRLTVSCSLQLCYRQAAGFIGLNARENGEVLIFTCSRV